MRGSTPKIGQKIVQKMPKKYWKNWKISGPNGLSKCPECIEMDSGPFRGKYVSTIFRWFFGPTFFEKMDLRRVLWPKCQVKKVSYIDPLVKRFSLKFESLIGIFHYFFSFLVKPCFLFFTIQKISSKENSYFRTSFWALFLLCCRWFSFLQKKTFSGKKQTPY